MNSGPLFCALRLRDLNAGACGHALPIDLKVAMGNAVLLCTDRVPVAQGVTVPISKGDPPI